MSEVDVDKAVEEAARAARGTVADLAVVPDVVLDGALLAMADRLGGAVDGVLAANGEDVRAARADGMADALADRLRLDGARLEAVARPLRGPAGGAGVLRTGSAAIRSAIALADEVIAPALGASGLDPAMIQLLRVPGQESARAL